MLLIKLCELYTLDDQHILLFIVLVKAKFTPYSPLSLLLLRMNIDRQTRNLQTPFGSDYLTYTLPCLLLDPLAKECGVKLKTV